ncbi:MAG: S9 family peptidase [Gammaproteobacteria bacterium]|nr:S9 family peptidase [Gammaproteobacteria bacterium]MYF39167.1 S9 family peptidase [Gammaproteobacteria bacterium]
MRFRTLRHIPMIVLCFCVISLFGQEAEESTEAPETVEPYPPEVWAANPGMATVRVSPDGKYLSWVSYEDATSVDGPVILVFDISGEGEMELVHRQKAEHMQILTYRWLSPTSFVMALRAQVRQQTRGFNQGVFASRIALVDVVSKEMETVDESIAGIAHVLPLEPTKIMISVQEGAATAGTRMASAYRPLAFYKLDLKTNKKTLVIRAKPSQFALAFDRIGNPVRSLGFDDNSEELVYYYRSEGSTKWTEYYRQHIDSYERFDPVGVDPTAKDHVFVIAHNGHDRAGFWSYDMANKRFAELIFRTSADEPEPIPVDDLSAVFHTNQWEQMGEVTGVEYFAGERQRVFMDELEGGIYHQLKRKIENSANLDIISRSSDGQTFVIFNQGPLDPGTYYLLHEGKMTVLGSIAPDIASDRLANVEYKSWESTDGKKIYGYVTIPQGEPPFPLVVLPHGGPHVTETVAYDPWAQMLANHGYMVLQPQYRGSHNYGLDFYKASFEGEESQAGRMMQTDKDTGALFLVEEGLADEDRLAMIGWSYGGYAALMATIRDPQIYQCAVAGAAVSDPVMQLNNYRYGLRGASKNEQFGTWLTAVSPIDEAEKVNIPLLLVHGSADARVSLDHLIKYRRQLEKFDKEYQYVELPNAAHFYGTLNYKHREKFYGEMLRFLKEDCGPDGL